MNVPDFCWVFCLEMWLVYHFVLSRRKIESFFFFDNKRRK